jgi:transposase
VARYRARWKKYQLNIDPKRLVFIDETWAKTNMAPIRGWFARGQRLKAKVPHGHWKTMTFLAALRHDRIDAPFVFDGPINGESFLLYVEQALVPTLLPVGARVLFLPAYSPDLNPIEQVFSKLKHLLRKAGERSVEATWRRIGTLLDRFSPAECGHYFVNSGYAPS